MEFQDKNLNCVDCGTEFLWTAGEQLFFADKNFKNEPKRCKSCKAKRASRPAGAAGMARERVETTTNCSACGKETTVPFRPTQGRPVFCRECFQQRKFAGAAACSVLSSGIDEGHAAGRGLFFCPAEIGWSALRVYNRGFTCSSSSCP